MINDGKKKRCEHPAFNAECKCMSCGETIEQIKDANPGIDDVIEKIDEGVKKGMEIAENPECVSKEVAEAAKDAGVSEEVIDAAGEAIKPHWDKLPRWAKVAIAAGVAVGLMLLRHYEWL